MKFEPKIISFLCNWCSYTGADLAGSSRMEYSSNIRIIRIMCTGRVGPAFVLKAFKSGADGILICGCHPGDCHYHEGNYKCMRRYALLQMYAKQIGIDGRRLKLEWVSASEGKQFAELADAFTKEIQQLGPATYKKDLQIV